MSTPVSHRALPQAIISELRPRQWLKNALVFAAPLAAGDILKPAVLVPSLIAFVAFCLISSATYIFNDLRDLESDRAHPVKRLRPVAAGDMSTGLAITIAAVLGLVALALALSVNVGLFAILLCYLAFTTSYSLFLKHEPVIELVLIAMGFLLRAIAGGVASELPISQWFLIVAGFGSLFMAAGKRYSELVRATESVDGGESGPRMIRRAGDFVVPGEHAPEMRRSLRGYTLSYLRFVWAIAAAVTITAYCLWAFEVALLPSSAPWAAWSVLPFVIGLLRYAIDIDKGDAEAPEDVVLHDPALMVTGLAWLVLFGLGSIGL
jgi:decaprenyl-phosphate phosphoribosyltransferase